MEDVRQFVIEYIQREYTVPDGIDIMNLNYVEAGYIDSIGLIQFIATIEDEFGIELTDEDMQNPEIRIVGKLIELVENKKTQQ